MKKNFSSLNTLEPDFKEYLVCVGLSGEQWPQSMAMTKLRASLTILTRGPIGTTYSDA